MSWLHRVAKTDWIMPNYRSEAEAILRASQQLKIDPRIIVAVIEQASHNSDNLVPLKPPVWESLENYGNSDLLRQAVSQSGEPDWEKIKAGLQYGKKYPAPIILCYKTMEGEKYHLLTGETRLMLAEHLGETPHVLMVRVPKVVVVVIQK